MRDVLRKDQSSSSVLPSYKHDVPHRSGTIRDEIYDIIEKNPGIRYRELTRIAEISNGVLTYHLEQDYAYGKNNKLDIKGRCSIFFITYI